jgi:hypothetical protein
MYFPVQSMTRAPLGMEMAPIGPHVGDSAVAHNHDGILQISCRVAPVGDIHNGAAGENKRDGADRLGNDLGLRLRPNQRAGQSRSTHTREDNMNKSHRIAGLFWIVAQRSRSKGSSLQPA